MKSFVSDKLQLADNPNIIAILNINGIIDVCLCVLFLSLQVRMWSCFQMLS